MSSAPRDGAPTADGADRPPAPGTAVPEAPAVPEATVARLPQYLRALSALAEAGSRTVSSEALAEAAGVGSAKLRKDLSHLGSYGTRGVGYDVEQLHRHIADRLGQAASWRVVIVGVGNLGHALAGYSGFASRGFTVVGLFDDDPAVIGRVVGGLRVRPLEEFGEVVGEPGSAIAVLAVPARHAQAVCDRLVAAGTRSVLNFAPTVLRVPDGVDVRKVDLASELQILAFHAQRRAAAPAHRPSAAGPRGATGAPAGPLLPHALHRVEEVV
ncbi:redox-sensing transcriptional repressor Rex [Paenibacillus sp. TRM 82003]|nr:redox-sensing transcriptional repressor Rex [Kineococcus sp. TRM81007]MCI2238880.1 redox-sensing transcriptional repressor Rex [Kineococcus sp. TRM81007]MCI3924285.1 redox-sensing transcriptional repressor Rex [Paenibacillus sp. TRM 82003]